MFTNFIDMFIRPDLLTRSSPSKQKHIYHLFIIVQRIQRISVELFIAVLMMHDIESLLREVINRTTDNCFCSTVQDKIKFIAIYLI